MGCVPDLLRTRLGNGRAMHERTLMHQVILPGTRACRAVTCSRLSLARMGTSRLAADRTDRLSGQRHIVPSCRWSGDQIGREGGRERVCQYVEVSGVDGSLQKK